MSLFFPALASTDTIGTSINGRRKPVSIRSFIPKKMKENFLTSLSFDESPHYEENGIEQVFIDCGAFHYVNEKVPKFKKGGYVNARSAIQHYLHRHSKRKNAAKSYLVCSPDHIISPDMSDEDSENRTKWTIHVAKEFIELCKEISNFTPVGVVHGRNKDERITMVEEYINLGYNYIAFGGLVPIARNESLILEQLAGINDYSEPKIDKNSPLGLAMQNGCKTHMFGLNSPEWYRWWKRLGVTSFDGSKLSQEGAANGIIWSLNEFDTKSPPSSAKGLYTKTKIKNLGERNWVEGKDGIYELSVIEDSILDNKSIGWEFHQNSLCMNNNCKQGNFKHRPDPRTTGSVEHNMGRTIINAHVFDALMQRIDDLVELADKSNDEIYSDWRSISWE
jgi:hypothetical protein